NSPFDLQTVHWTVCFTIKPRQAHNLKVRGSNPTPANQNKTHHHTPLTPQGALSAFKAIPPGAAPVLR
ncbi:hypothetical protein, partial [Ruegeria meonggei]|uniref:hypothetical protein n=1 Tax=Ruegeria meonggei TaxID=1446476 RepID=UPI001F445385